jgi:hypothetical protein
MSAGPANSPGADNRLAAPLRGCGLSPEPVDVRNSLPKLRPDSLRCPNVTHHQRADRRPGRGGLDRARDRRDGSLVLDPVLRRLEAARGVLKPFSRAQTTDSVLSLGLRVCHFSPHRELLRAGLIDVADGTDRDTLRSRVVLSAPGAR